jgi:hypothetical protein
VFIEQGVRNGGAVDGIELKFADRCVPGGGELDGGGVGRFLICIGGS